MVRIYTYVKLSAFGSLFSLMSNESKCCLWEYKCPQWSHSLLKA
jgi:hypothetical protein